MKRFASNLEYRELFKENILKYSAEQSFTELNLIPFFAVSNICVLLSSMKYKYLFVIEVEKALFHIV